MTVLKVITEPDPLLHKMCAPVEKVDAGIQKTLDDMLETMYAYDGVGLAAPQVGVLQRMLVIDTGDSPRATKKNKKTNQGPLKIVNPEIFWTSNHNYSCTQGCVSIPGYYANVNRPAEVKIRYQDEEGNPQELFADGLLAVIVQHEIDHLNGITLINYIEIPEKSPDFITV